MITNRNFTWRHVPNAPPTPPQLWPLADDGEGLGEDESSQGASSQGGGWEKTSST